MIQPPRGFGENPVAIYHDPDLPPSHHYLAAYRWLDHEFGAHAVVHLGKHGTLEWLPGKGLGLSAQCAPDAVLRRPAAGLPVHRQRPRRGHPGQAARPRDHRRPPDPADGPRRHLRRAGQAGAAARRVRHRGRAGPGQAAHRARPDLVRWSAPPSCTTTCAVARRARRGRVRRLRAAHRRLPVRDQGRRRSGTACTSWARAPEGEALVNLRAGHPARPPRCGAAAVGALPGLRAALGLLEGGDAAAPSTDRYERTAGALIEAMAAADRLGSRGHRSRRRPRWRPRPRRRSADEQVSAGSRRRPTRRPSPACSSSPAPRSCPGWPRPPARSAPC